MQKITPAPGRRPGSLRLGAPGFCAGLALVTFLVACSGGPFRRGDDADDEARLTVDGTAHRSGAVRMGPGFYPDPYELSGQTGGSVDAAYIGQTPAGPCMGLTEAVPNHRITLDEDFEYLRFDVQASGDTTLLLQGPTGWLCSDDADGTRPRIEAVLTAGTYRLWIGTDGPSESGDYTLSVTQNRPDGSAQADANAPQSGGVAASSGAQLDVEAYEAAYERVGLSPGFRPQPVEVEGRAGGSVDASYLSHAAGRECYGFADAQPNHVLTLHSDFEMLAVGVEAEAGVNVLIYGPDGWQCGGDERGGIAGSFEAGEYLIWVASVDASQAPAYDLLFSSSRAAMLGELDVESGTGRYEPLRLGGAYDADPGAVAGLAGGPVEVDYLGYTAAGRCEGFADSQPNHLLWVDRDEPFVSVEVEGHNDLRLLMHGPDGWLCASPEAGLPARHVGPLTAGQYQVWVATDRSDRASQYWLSVGTGRAGASPGPAPGYDRAPDYGATPSYDSTPSYAPTPAPTPGRPAGGGRAQLDLASFSPRDGSVAIDPGGPSTTEVLRGTAGGRINASLAAQSSVGSCAGWVGSTPNHVVTVNGAGGELGLEVSSTGEASLLVHGPDGWQCSDGDGWYSPSLEANFRPGVYRVWVGAGAVDEPLEYQITVTSQRQAM